MQYFTALSLRRGKIFLDGVCLGESTEGDAPRIFRCCAGLHDVTLEYHHDGARRRQTKRLRITGTTPILPLAIPFICEL